MDCRIMHRLAPCGQEYFDIRAYLQKTGGTGVAASLLFSFCMINKTLLFLLSGAAGILCFSRTAPAETPYVVYGEHGAAAIAPLDNGDSAPRAIGKAARAILDGPDAKTQNITIMPVMMGLRGPSVRMIRSDLEKAQRHAGSPQEIWRHTEFQPAPHRDLKLWRTLKSKFALRRFSFVHDNQVARAENDDLQYRSSFVAGSAGPNLFGLIDTGYAFRANIAHEIDNAANPVRGDAGDFADNAFALDTLYGAVTHSFRSDLHMSLVGGYLEEMFAGGGGEILYRPFDSRLALGLEGWYARKRDPDSFLHTGLGDYDTFTGHINLWYDIPWQNITLHAQAGRYLAEDTGGMVALKKTFRNGMALEGYVTATGDEGTDLFGENSSIAQGLRLTIPLGGYPYMPRGTEIRMRAEAFTRGAGQALANPLPLYEVTEPFSKKNMAEHWDEVVP